MTDSGLWHIQESVKQWQIYHLRIGFTFGALTEDPYIEVTIETHIVYSVKFGSPNQDIKCLRDTSSVISAASDQDDINL